MSSPRPVEIVGGGLAGLSLGLALRRAGVDVTVYEAGHYPRHRVCGEFITGLPRRTRERLGLDPFLADAAPNLEDHLPEIPGIAYRQGGQVRFTNPRMSQMPLNIQWDLKPSILVNPAELVFQDTAGKELRQKLNLKQADGKPFRVTAAHPSMQGMRVEGLNQRAGTMDLTVVLPATLKAGRYTDILTLSTDDPNQPELTIRVVALLN